MDRIGQTISFETTKFRDQNQYNKKLSAISEIQGTNYIKIDVDISYSQSEQGHWNLTGIARVWGIL